MMNPVLVLLSGIRFRLVLLAVLALPFTGQAADVSRQPLPVMQANPAMIRYFDPRPSSARLLGAGNGQFNLDQQYASIFLADMLPNPKRYLADMELYVIEAGLRYGISESTDIEVDVPVMRPLAGVLDPFLRDYHRALGLPNGGRAFQPDNRFSYRYRSATGGWTGHSRWEMGNLRFKLRQQWIKDRLTVMAGVQLPRASRSHGWTNGGIDAGLGMVGSWESKTWFMHLEGWWLHPFARDDAGSPVRDYLRGAWTLGKTVRFLAEPFNLIAQVQGGSTPYRTGIVALDAEPWLIGFGIRGAIDSDMTGKAQWSVSFIENITQQSTQDFGVSLGLTVPLTFSR